MQVLLKFIALGARNPKDNVNLCKTCIGNRKNGKIYISLIQTLVK